jgi:hypothetical protein
MLRFLKKNILWTLKDNPWLHLEDGDKSGQGTKEGADKVQVAAGNVKYRG